MDCEMVHKHVDDIIDARTLSGEYDELVSSVKPQCVHARYTYSAPTRPSTDIKDDLLNYSEGDNNNDTHFLDVNTTDSEVTVIRVKREGSKVRTSPSNNWDMHDKSIPGDGTHLADSPSLVNLVAMVAHTKQNVHSNKKKAQEFMVPLSSWEPARAVVDEVKIDMPPSDSYIAKKRGFRDIFGCLLFWRQRRSAMNTVYEP